MPSTAVRRPDAALRPDIDDGDLEGEMADDPVLRSVLTAPVRPGRPPEWEAEALQEAAAGAWFEGATVSAEIAARARRG